MASDRISTYRQLLEEVREEIASRTDEFERLRQELVDLDEQERHLASLCGDVTLPPSDTGSRTGRGRDPGIDGSFSAAVRRVAHAAIKAAGRPLNRMEILEAVQKEGIPLPENNPEKKVSKILWGDKTLKNDRGEGYSLAK